MKKLAEKQKALDKLQEKYDAALHALEESQATAAKTQKQLTDATTHIKALSGEQERWAKQAHLLREYILRTARNATIGAAFNSFCSMFNHPVCTFFLNEAWPNILSANTIPSQGQIDIIGLFVTEWQTARREAEERKECCTATINNIANHHIAILK